MGITAGVIEVTGPQLAYLISFVEVVAGVEVTVVQQVHI
jgi:hypothetical protein